jgi:hypothetical protein
MRAILDPFLFVVISIAGWMNQHQQHVIEYLIEENRVLQEQIGNRRLRFSDNQRRRLAARAKPTMRLPSIGFDINSLSIPASRRELCRSGRHPCGACCCNTS